MDTLFFLMFTTQLYVYDHGLKPVNQMHQFVPNLTRQECPLALNEMKFDKGVLSVKCVMTVKPRKYLQKVVYVRKRHK